MSASPAYLHLQEQIRRNQVIAARVDALDAATLQSLARLQHWQRQRLDATYADLRASAR